MVLDDFYHQAVHRSPHCSDLMKHCTAFLLRFERAFKRLDLPANSADADQHLGFFPNGVAHGRVKYHTQVCYQYMNGSPGYRKRREPTYSKSGRAAAANLQATLYLRQARQRPETRGPAPNLTASALTMKTIALFVVTAVAEIVGCYLPYLWLKRGGSAWLLVPATASLFLFAWLLTLHPTAAGRVYAAYGGVYVGVAILWLWFVDGTRPTAWDLIGAAIAMGGMAVIMFSPRA